jgi:hypothetical protein
MKAQIKQLIAQINTAKEVKQEAPQGSGGGGEYYGGSGPRMFTRVQRPQMFGGLSVQSDW